MATETRFCALFCAIFCAISFTVLAAANAAEPVDFTKQVLPVLRAKCLDCHGGETAESNLRLDSMVAALRGGDSGERSIVPGDPDRSHLMERVRSNKADLRMPPEGDPLTPEEVAVLRRWIAAKPNWQSAARQLADSKTEHWSFQPVAENEPPIVPGLTHPVDRFVTARLHAKGLGLSPRAARRQRLRRLYLVMHGVPPTPEQTERFVADVRPDAWERAVDEVLEHPRYGERWASHWLDLVRFGETHGFETNRERPNAWRYRDWVIDSLNADKPYDAFVREQIAGDALDAPLGTGFLVAGPYDLVKGQDPDLRLMQRQDELADMVNTTGATFLGLTIGCARCHNHKFDPISQTEFYAMQAVFAGVNHAARSLPMPDIQRQQLEEMDARIASLRKQLAPLIARPALAQRLIDDRLMSSDQRPMGWQYLQTPAGEGKNPVGNTRGQLNDPGDDERAPNVSGGAYTWWKNKPGADVALCQTATAGRHRIWLSWGWGWDSHSEDARYLLDRDGDPATQDDQQLIATINQQHFAEAGDNQPVPKQALWSGFYNAGVHELRGSEAIVLRCGKTGSAITTDAILLEPVKERDANASPSKPRIRAAVNAKRNVERFVPVEAKFVRFTILQTNASQPCLDELEVFAKQGEAEVNVGLRANGAKATSSGDFVHALHKLAHINDGKYGNAKSWIAAVRENGWVQLEFPKPTTIHRIEWGRDREGRYADRVATKYRIAYSMDGEHWNELASDVDRLPFQPAKDAKPVQYDFARAGNAEQKQAARQHFQTLQELLRQRESLAKPVMAYVGTFSQPGPTHRLYRGEPQSPREQVAPAALTSLSSLKLPTDAAEQSRRKAIAEWIASTDNPLTARVMVNRIWQHQFGVGIVDTPSDFGANGTDPTHPALLDWLAAEFMRSGWSIKHMQRLILLSRTWQQQSTPSAKGLAADAGSRLLWRFPPRRLEAEAIRDATLLVAGSLDDRMAGPGFSAFEVQLENVRHYFPKKNYGPEDWRRMIYMTKVRQERDSVFGVFDCPDYSQVVPKRSRSTTPLQALNLFNSRFVNQQAERMAKVLTAENKSDPARVKAAFAAMFSREPSQVELDESVAFIREAGLPQFLRAMLNSNEFVFVQ